MLVRDARIVLIVVVGACFRPAPPPGAPCAHQTDCPDPLVCVEELCVAAPGDGGLVDAPPDISIDADPSCLCKTGALVCGGAQPVTCTLGCMDLSPGARCLEVDPSNGVGVTAAATLVQDKTITASATFDTDTGAITGGLTRAPGQGVNSGIAFELRATGTTPLGVWTFHQLTLDASGTIRFKGARAAVFVVGTIATISGTIDGSGGCSGNGAASCGGPGAGTGASATAATGCGPGGLGGTDAAGVDDGGGGGGGGRGAGGLGGLGGTLGTTGAAGASCVAATLEPLIGGSGGGAGGKGAVTPCHGGGGGGALQITALDSIVVTGTIQLVGAGGEGGVGDPAGNNGGAGCGGGGGGGLLLEAPAVRLGAMAVLTANGGAGGGGAYFDLPGAPGEPGTASTTPAVGGAAAGVNAGPGGNGAAGSTAAQPAPTAPANAGGGGGAIGAIYLRTSPGALMMGGTVTPAAGTGPIRIQ